MADRGTQTEPLRLALLDLIEAVDSVCQSDVAGEEPTLQSHARSVLELALQRAKEAVADEQ